jgi:hypothetical protein
MLENQISWHPPYQVRRLYSGAWVPPHGESFHQPFFSHTLIELSISRQGYGRCGSAILPASGGDVTSELPQDYYLLHNPGTLHSQHVCIKKINFLIFITLHPTNALEVICRVSAVFPTRRECHERHPKIGSDCNRP